MSLPHSSADVDAALLSRLHEGACNDVGLWQSNAWFVMPCFATCAGSRLLKFGRKGRPKFRHIRLSDDMSHVYWQSTWKRADECRGPQPERVARLHLHLDKPWPRMHSPQWPWPALCVYNPGS